jgi:hypothetical protein
MQWGSLKPELLTQTRTSHSNQNLASPAFGGCSFLRDCRAEAHSAVQRIPRSHSSASLRSRSALALSRAASASRRYRAARALLMAFQILNATKRGLKDRKKIWFLTAPAAARLPEAQSHRAAIGLAHKVDQRRREEIPRAGFYLQPATTIEPPIRMVGVKPHRGRSPSHIENQITAITSSTPIRMPTTLLCRIDIPGLAQRGIQ